MTATPEQLADAQHPWIGLASFTEVDCEFFAGRGEEIDELLRLVHRDTLTLLYGVSGLGKTSLLRAGIFPAVRAEDWLPVPIRLDYSASAQTLAAQVLGAISTEASGAGVETPKSRPGETLWEYFHREDNHFWSPRNDLVTPFLVFDQFEEAFTLGRENPARVTRVLEFISEFADLVENRPPAALRDDPQRVREFSFKPVPLKVLLAMREDYLAELDGIRSQFRALGQNRMRLLPMGALQARQVIDLGASILAPGVADRIVAFTAGNTSAADGDEIAVAPALLSLVLRELNERRLARGPDAKITPDLLDVEQQKILEDFYLRTVQDFPAGVRNFVEDELLTATGYRNSCALDDALSNPDVTQPILDELVNRRLLAYEDRHHARRVEITHDVLAPVITTSRDTRLAREALEEAERQKAEAREAERKARNWRLVVGGGLVLAVIAGASFGIWQASVAREETAKANAATVWAEELNEQMIDQSIRGELNTVFDLKLEEDWANRLRQLDTAIEYSGESNYPRRNAEAAAVWAKRRSEQFAKAAAALWAELRYGAASRAPLVRSFVESDTNIRRMIWSPTGDLLATAGKHKILLWSFSSKDSTEAISQSCGSSSGDVSGLRFSADGKLLFVMKNQGWDVISIAQRKVIFSSNPGESLLAGDAISPDGMKAVSRFEGGPPRVIPTTVPDPPGLELPDELPSGSVVAWSPKGDRVALADEDKRTIVVYSISETGAALLTPKPFEAFSQIAAIRTATNRIAPQVNELSFSDSGDMLLVKDSKGFQPLYEIWAIDSTGAERKNFSLAEFRAWLPDRSLLLDIPVGDGPAVISSSPFKEGRALFIKDAGRPQFSVEGPDILFIQSKRNYQVLNVENGYPVTPPFGWWLGSITARMSLRPGLIASVENVSGLSFWDLRPEQPRWHADPPQPPPLAPVKSPDGKWIADLSVDQRVQVSQSDDESHPLVQISLDEQPSSVGWSEDGRYLRIYSKNRGYIDLEWDPPTDFEESIRKLVQLLVTRDINGSPPKERFALRKEMSTWKAKDPRWQKLLNWWVAGRPSEPPPPEARFLTEPPTDAAISSPPVGRDDSKSSVWVFHDSNTRPLTEADLGGLSDDELWTARNEIYARRGFGASWKSFRKLIERLGPEFHPTDIVTDSPYDFFNGVEKANVMLIKATENQRLLER